MRCRAALILVLSLAPTSGCTWLALGVNNAHHMTVERKTTPRVSKRFRVVDAETDQPVVGARLTVVHNFDWMDDWVMNGTTDAEGFATFRLATEYLHLLHVHAGADGYLTRDSLYFSDRARTPGTGRIEDDPVTIHLYKGPQATAGLRVPADFCGTLVYQFGPTKYDFPFPPDFPAAKRVWWTDVTPGVETVVEQPPRLGFEAGDAAFQIADSNGRPISMPEPGADVDGFAAWRIGTRKPDGPWGRMEHLIVVGERAAALVEARQMWDQHGNDRTGYIPNGWLKVVSPQTNLVGERPGDVTRVEREQ